MIIRGNIPRSGGVFSPRDAESKIDMKHTEVFRHHLGVNDIQQYPEHVNMRTIQPTIDVGQHGYSNPVVDNRFWSRNTLELDDLYGVAFNQTMPAHQYGASVVTPSYAETRAILINHYMRITSCVQFFITGDLLWTAEHSQRMFAYEWYVLVAGTGSTTPRFVGYEEQYIYAYRTLYHSQPHCVDLVLSPGDLLMVNIKSLDTRMASLSDIVATLAWTVELYGTLCPLGCYPPCAWN